MGFGDVAARMAPMLATRFKIYGLIRRPAEAARLRELGVVPILGSLDQRKSLERLRGLADLIVHLAPPNSEELEDSRTKRLLAALSRPAKGLSRRRQREYSQGNESSAPRLVYISTSGVYGNCAGALVDEARPVSPESPRAQRRVSAERLVREWMRRNPLRRTTSILRVPGIYAEDRLPVGRLQAGTPALLASEDSFSNHVHAGDLARISILTLYRGRNGRSYNASDDAPMLMGDYFDKVADHLGLARPARVSRAEAEQILPESLLSFMRESRRLSNRRLRKELRVQLRYPDFGTFLREVSGGH